MPRWCNCKEQKLSETSSRSIQAVTTRRRLPLKDWEFNCWVHWGQRLSFSLLGVLTFHLWVTLTSGFTHSSAASLACCSLHTAQWFYLVQLPAMIRVTPSIFHSWPQDSHDLPRMLGWNKCLYRKRGNYDPDIYLESKGLEKVRGFQCILLLL